MASQTYSADAVCPLAESPIHELHLHIRSILDALQLESTQLQWKVSDRRTRGLLGPCSIEGDEDKLDTPVYGTLVDTISINLHKSLDQVDEQIKLFRNSLVHHAAGRLDDDQISCRCGAPTFHGSLSDLDVSFRQNSVFWEVAKLHCLSILKIIKETSSQIIDVTHRRSPYRFTYLAAYHATLTHPTENRLLPIFNGMTKEDHQRIYPSYCLQSLHQQGQDLFEVSKKIVFLLEELHKLKSESTEKFSDLERALPQFSVVAEKFERSLQQCSKYPHSIVGASNLVQNASNSVRHSSVYLSSGRRNGKSIRTPEVAQKSLEGWDDSLKFLEDYRGCSLAKDKRLADIGNPSDKSSTVATFHRRAGIFYHDKHSEESKSFCERENITLENIGSLISRAYPQKILFDGHPVGDDFTDKQGGCGKVYKVTLPFPRTFIIDLDVFGGEETHTLFCEKVSVKKIILSPGLSESRACARVLRELEARVVLRHESILPLIGLWSNFDDSDLDYPLLVSPWMEDGDLHQFLECHPETSVLSRLSFLRDVASALAYMHEYHNVEFVHGDLKADNVLVNEGRAYLHDFGTTRIIGEDAGLRTRNPSGTWRWQAPELLDRFRGIPVVDIHPSPQSDMYAYGSLFLEVFSGEQPWDMPDALEYRIQHRSKIQKRPSSINNDRYWALMNRCWIEEPTLRSTARQALMEVKDLIELEQHKQDGQISQGADFKVDSSR